MHLLERPAESVMQIRVVRVARDRVAIMVDGLGKAVQHGQRCGKAFIIDSIGRSERAGGFETLQRGVEVAARNHRVAFNAPCDAVGGW